MFIEKVIIIMIETLQMIIDAGSVIIELLHKTQFLTSTNENDCKIVEKPN